MDFIINNVQLLLLSNNTDSDNFLQNINAENVIKNHNSKKQIISINKNHHHDADEYISIGAWVSLNNSLYSSTFERGGTKKCNKNSS